MISIIQGLAITAGTLTVYFLSVQSGFDESLTRSMVFTTLIMANVFLTFVNRSFDYSLLTVLQYKNKLLWIAIIITLIALAMILYIPSLSGFFKVTSLNPVQISQAIVVAFISVIWFELWKLRRSRAITKQ